MFKNNKQEIASILASVLVLSGAASYALAKEDSANVEVDDNNTYITYDEPKYVFHYENDTVDVDEAIRELNINNNSTYPYNTYKVIRYVDSNHFEKIAICHIYTSFLTDNEGKITDTIYTYEDAFNGNQLLTTTDGLNDHVGDHRIESFTSGDVLLIMDQGDLLDLRDIVIKKGMGISYAYSIMSDDIKDKSLSTEEVARMYVLLVKSNNRNINNSEAIILSY